MLRSVSFRSIFWIAFAVTLFFVVVIPPQRAEGATRSQLIAEICKCAERHVRSGSAMQSQVVVETFSNNDCGLTSEEILRTYELEYDELLRQRKQGLLTTLKRSGLLGLFEGLFSLTVIALVGAFSESARQAAKELLNRLLNLLYSGIAGKRCFKGMALRRYRGSLRRQHSCMRVPFKPEKAIPMKDIYVPLRLLEDFGLRGVDAFTALAEHRRVLVKGGPGAGKSMLLKNLVLAFTDHPSIGPPKSLIPVLVELHRLNDSTISIKQLLLDEFNANCFPHSDRFLEESLQRGGLILLLDGFDEIGAEHRIPAAQKIRDFLRSYSKCRCVVTCRSAVYSSELSDVVDRVVEISDLNEQEIVRILNNWGPDMTAEKSPEQLMQILRDQPHIMSLARNPLLLSIIVYLYNYSLYDLPVTRSEFYRQATDFLLGQWHKERNKYQARDKKRVLQQLALKMTDRDFPEKDGRCVDYQSALSQIRTSISELGLSHADPREFLDEIVERSGLLVPISDGEQYTFAHLTIQEFFAAGALVTNEEGILKRFELDIDTWREVVKLWCGLAHGCTQFLDKIYHSDIQMALECLVEAEQVDSAVADKILSDVENSLGPCSDEITLKAFGLVASDNSGPRGRGAFGFLEKLLTDKDSRRREVAAKALSYTDLPRAADVLLHRCMAREEVRLPLLRMGDLAVPTLARAAQDGSIAALDDLTTIGSPMAAMLMVPLLWHQSGKLAASAAWRLASLFSNEEVLTALTRFDLSEGQRRGEFLDWIWSPFGEAENSPLRVIAGRIAFLIQNESPKTAPSEQLYLDARLLIPLCYTSAHKELLFLAPSKHQGMSGVEVAAAHETGTHDENSLRTLNRHSLKQAAEHLASKGSDDEKEQFVNRILEASGSSARFRQFINRLRPEVRFDLMRRLLKGVTPTNRDWVNIYRPLQYSLSTGWHYTVILVITGLLTLTSAAELLAQEMSTPPFSLEGFSLHFGLLVLALGVAVPFGRKLISLPDVVLPVVFFGPFLLAFYCAGLLSGSLRKATGLDRADLLSAVETVPMQMWTIIITVYASKGITRFLNSSKILHATLWVASAATIIVLWVIGKMKERKAQNPLSGILEPQPTHRSAGSLIMYQLFGRM